MTMTSGFALDRISTGEELAWWRVIPGTVVVPGEQITVDGAGEGWTFGDFHIVARQKDIPEFVPIVITDGQFAHALYKMGVITHEERMAFVKTGEIPSALRNVIDAIPDQEMRRDAEYLVSGAQTFSRLHPMTEALRQGMGWTVQQMLDLWLAGSKL